MTAGTGEPVEIAEDGPESSDDERLIHALRQRDEAAFVALVDRYQGQLVRLAMTYVSRACLQISAQPHMRRECGPDSTP